MYVYIYIYIYIYIGAARVSSPSESSLILRDGLQLKCCCCGKVALLSMVLKLRFRPKTPPYAIASLGGACSSMSQLRSQMSLLRASPSRGSR